LSNITKISPEVVEKFTRRYTELPPEGRRYQLPKIALSMVRIQIWLI